MLSGDVVIEEAANACNMAHMQEFSPDDLLTLLEKIRLCDGFSKAELCTITETFRFCDIDNSSELGPVELLNAARYLGFQTDIDQVKVLVKDFDVDESEQL